MFSQFFFVFGVVCFTGAVLLLARALWFKIRPGTVEIIDPENMPGFSPPVQKTLEYYKNEGFFKYSKTGEILISEKATLKEEREIVKLAPRDSTIILLKAGVYL